MSDGTRLSARLFLPGDGIPSPVLLEALPYRKDDLTASYSGEYRRLRDEGHFAVARVDLRGTGASEGLAEDEYPAQEQADLVEVIAWLAAAPWSNGRTMVTMVEEEPATPAPGGCRLQGLPMKSILPSSTPAWRRMA